MGLRFSFDVGTNSIGWAVWRTGVDPSGIFGADAPLELLSSSVRLFKDGRNPKDGQSLAAMRRGPRQARKRRDRFRLRQRDLVKAMTDIGLFPADTTERKLLEARDPYQLRAKALTAGLSPFEIGRVLFHLNQRRGFKSNRKTDRSDKNKGKIASASQALGKRLEELDCRTIGQFLWLRHSGEGLDPSRPRAPGRQPTRIRLEGEGAKALYEFYPTREMIVEEFNEIWRSQAAHHPEILISTNRERLYAILFRQRPLKPPKVGRCAFESKEDRLPKALPSVLAREIYERLNHLRLGPNDRRLTPSERDALASVLLNDDKLTFVKMRNALKLGGNVTISLEEAGEKELQGLKISKILQKPDHFGPKWRTLTWADRDRFVQRLLDEVDDEELSKRLMAEFRLSAEQAANCASAPLPDGYSRLGATANAAILEALVDGRNERGEVLTYAEAVAHAAAMTGADWHHSAMDIRSGAPAPDAPARLPYYGAALQRHIIPGSFDAEDRGDDAAFFGRFANPTVHIGLNQLRYVVNSLIATFGHPDQIVVELARELKLNKDQKDELKRRNSDNRTANELRGKLLAEQGVANNGEARARLKLFEEQQRANAGVALCPFSGRPLSIEKLFSPEVEVEHLLPWSRTFDDSLANKVLCYRDANRRKRGLAPFEAFGAQPDWPDILGRAAGLPANKRWRFQPDAMERFDRSARSGMSDAERNVLGLDKGFLARQLNETKYLARLARQYLTHVCLRFDAKTGERIYGDVYVTTGTLTGLLRGKWGLNGLLGDDNFKNRDDHRNHALDAIIIGAMTRSWLNYLAREAGRAEQTEFARIIDKMPWPFPGFRDAVRATLEQVIVSHKAEQGKTGALHEDTAYGTVDAAGEAAVIGNLVRRKPVADLTANEVDAIRDPALRKRAQEAIADLRDAKGKVADAKRLRQALTNFAGREGIRRIRVGKEDRSVVTIADRRTGAPYKAVVPGENHHIDIVQMRDGSWKGFAATLFEVNRKDFRPQWEREKLGGKLVMRLHKGDMVEVADESGKRVVKVVVRIEPSAGRVRLVEHTAGGDFQKRHDDNDDPFRWDLASISKLKERGCVAVRVDEIGRVTARRSNV